MILYESIFPFKRRRVRSILSKRPRIVCWQHCTFNCRCHREQIANIYHPSGVSFPNFWIELGNNIVFLCSWSSLMVYLSTANCLWVVYSFSCRFIKSSQVFIHGSNCWIESMFRFALEGHFHADPHPGNLLVEKGTERRRALCFRLVGMHQIVLRTFVYIGCGPLPAIGMKDYVDPLVKM